VAHDEADGELAAARRRAAFTTAGAVDHRERDAPARGRARTCACSDAARKHDRIHQYRGSSIPFRDAGRSSSTSK
jgi:hypothetical protein